MNIITGLLTLPLAPLRGVIWLGEKVAEVAEREIYDENRIRAQMMELELAYETGAIDERSFARMEEQLVERLREARRMKRD